MHSRFEAIRAVRQRCVPTVSYWRLYLTWLTLLLYLAGAGESPAPSRVRLKRNVVEVFLVFRRGVLGAALRLLGHHTIELSLEQIRKGYSSSEEVETPEIRKALAQATPESLARFEEKYQLPVTQEIRLVGFPDKGQLVVRRIELDGTVRSFLVEGEAAKEQRADSRTGRRERAPLALSRDDVREFTSEEERKLLEVQDLSE